MLQDIPDHKEAKVILKSKGLQGLKNELMKSSQVFDFGMANDKSKSTIQTRRRNINPIRERPGDN